MEDYFSTEQQGILSREVKPDTTVDDMISLIFKLFDQKWNNRDQPTRDGIAKFIVYLVEKRA